MSLVILKVNSFIRGYHKYRLSGNQNQETFTDLSVSLTSFDQVSKEAYQQRKGHSQWETS